MKQFSYVLTRPQGLHIRPTGSLIKEASRFSSRISLNSGMDTAELKKGRLFSTLNVPCGGRITVMAEGSDEEAAIAAMQNYFVANM